MGIYSYASNKIRAATAYYQRRHSRRMIENLPGHILKDIGWPSQNAGIDTRRGH